MLSNTYDLKSLLTYDIRNIFKITKHSSFIFLEHARTASHPNFVSAGQETVKTEKKGKCEGLSLFEEDNKAENKTVEYLNNTLYVGFTVRVL